MPYNCRFYSNDTYIEYKGDWLCSAKHSLYLGKPVYITDDLESEVSIKFFGSSIKYYGLKSSKCVQADIFIDGEKVETLDLYNLKDTEIMCLYQNNNLALSYHTIAIRKHMLVKEGYINLHSFETSINYPGNTSVFYSMKIDRNTKGFWKGIYGGKGYEIFEDIANITESTVYRFGGQYRRFIWKEGSSDQKSLQETPGGKIAGFYHSFEAIELDVVISEGTIALYVYRVWDGGDLKINVIDNYTGNELYSCALEDYSEGVYLVFNLKGNVKIRLQSVPDTMLNGIFWQ